MTKKMRTLDRLKEARRRLRDVAAGAHAVADAHRADAARAHTEAVQHLSDELDGALARLSAASDVRTLYRLQDDVHAARVGVNTAAQVAKKAEVESERRRVLLAARARELKLTEELYERSREAFAKAEQKHEQKLSDDLGATRATRGE